MQEQENTFVSTASTVVAADCVPKSSEEQEVGMVGLRMQDMAVDVGWDGEV